MRAVGLFTHGGPEVLKIVDLPEVHAGPGQMRIRARAATVNPTDVGVRNGSRARSSRDRPKLIILSIIGRPLENNRASQAKKLTAAPSTVHRRIGNSAASQPRPRIPRPR
jgi:hypothetical protein